MSKSNIRALLIIPVILISVMEAGFRRHSRASYFEASFKIFSLKVFSGKCSSHTAQFAASKGRDQAYEELTTVGENQLGNHLRNLKVHRSVGLDKMQLRVLRELADEFDKTLSITFEKMWQAGEVPTDWKWENVTLVFKKGGEEEDSENYRPVSLTSARQDPSADYARAHGK